MFAKNFFFTLFLIISVSFSFSQTQKELKKMSYGNISGSFFKYEGNLKKQLFCAELYLKKAITEKKNIEIAVAYDFFSMAYLENDLEKANFYVDLAIKNSVKNPDLFYPMNAYWNKAVILSRQDKYYEAITFYTKAEGLARKYNPDFYYAIKLNIGILKSEYLGEVDQAIKIYKECYNFYKKEERKGYYHDFRIRTMFSLADAYKSLKQNDSATYYNKLGYANSKKYKDGFHLSLFILNEGANLINKKKYQSAIDSLNVVFSKIICDKKLSNNVIPIFFYYGKAYLGLKNNKKAAENFIKVDSVYNKTKTITPEFTDGYRFLIDYYKKANNKDKQLYYINTLMAIDSGFQINYKQLTQKLHADYDIPSIIKQKEVIIKSLNNDRYINYYIIVVLIVLIFLSFCFFANQKKVYKERFDKLIIENQQIEEIIKKGENIPKVLPNNTEISPEIVSDILQKLIGFERQKLYLNPSLTVQLLAQDFNTNSKYLSNIINNNINKTFTHYINDLRIENIINELKKNKKLRKYTVSSIAEEAGFNTGESFSKAFSRVTGIKPAYFIKKLNEM